jgi:hypothetical protein
MGWTSGTDTMKQVNLTFDSKAAAVAFCEHNGASCASCELPPSTHGTFARRFALYNKICL